MFYYTGLYQIVLHYIKEERPSLSGEGPPGRGVGRFAGSESMTQPSPGCQWRCSVGIVPYGILKKFQTCWSFVDSYIFDFSA